MCGGGVSCAEACGWHIPENKFRQHPTAGKSLFGTSWAPRGRAGRRVHSPSKVVGMLCWKHKPTPRASWSNISSLDFVLNMVKKTSERCLQRRPRDLCFQEEPIHCCVNSCCVKGEGSMEARGRVQGDTAAGMGREGRSLAGTHLAARAGPRRVMPVSLPRPAGWPVRTEASRGGPACGFGYHVGRPAYQTWLC